jgi:tetrahydromethanopterin S-methyltransferase subunit B
MDFVTGLVTAPVKHIVNATNAGIDQSMKGLGGVAKTALNPLLPSYTALRQAKVDDKIQQIFPHFKKVF